MKKIVGKEERTGHRWSTKEDESLMKHVLKGDTSVKDLLKKHGRTSSAIGYRINKLLFEKYGQEFQNISNISNRMEWDILWESFSLRDDILQLTFDCHLKYQKYKNPKEGSTSIVPNTSVESRFLTIEKRLHSIEEKVDALLYTNTIH